MTSFGRSERAAVLLAGLALTMTACGSSSSTTANTPITAAATDSSSPATTPTGSSGSSGSGCDGKATPVADALKSMAEVTAVQVIGGCHEADVKTNLAPGLASTAKALAICDSAAAAAYANGLLSVTVEGTDGHELAAGLKDSHCIGG